MERGHLLKATKSNCLFGGNKHILVSPHLKVAKPTAGHFGTSRPELSGARSSWMSPTFASASGASCVGDTGRTRAEDPKPGGVEFGYVREEWRDCNTDIVSRLG